MIRVFPALIKGNWYGAFLIVLIAVITTLSNSLTHSLPKELPAAQILSLKAGLGLIGVTLIHWRSLPKLVRTRFLPWQLVKAIAGVLGNWFWISSLQVLPLADCSALSLTSALITTAGAYYFFSERPTWPIIWAIIFGFVGVLFIVQPSQQVFSFYAFFPLLSALAFSASSLVVKKVSLKDSSYTTLFYLLCFMTLFSLIPALWEWHSLAFYDFLKLGAIAFLYTGGQMALIEAYTYGAASFLAPFKFSRFPLMIISGVLLFGEHVSWGTLLGGWLIIASYVTLGRKAKTAPKAYFSTKTNA